MGDDTPIRHFETDALESDLRGRSVRGGAVTLVSQASQLIVGLISTAILARLLSPADFGLVGMVTAVTGFIHQFKDLGLTTSTIQSKQINHDQLSALFWINVLLGIMVALMVAAMAPALAWFYGDARLAPITLVLSFAFILGGLTSQHQSLLRRKMRFAALAVVDNASRMMRTVVGVSLALAGFGYWTLVMTELASAVTLASGVWLASGWHPGKPKLRSGIRSMLVLGGNLSVSRVVNYFVRSLDKILIGWKRGPLELGVYTKAYGLLMLPIRQFNTPLTRVAIPALSRLQDYPRRYRQYFRKALLLIVAVAMPIVVLTLVLADSIVLLILGDQWTRAVPIFRLLGPAAFIGTFNLATGWVYISTGQTHRQLRWVLVESTALVVGIVIGIQWGPEGVALAFSLVLCSTRIPGILYCFKTAPVSIVDLFAAVWRPAVGSIAAGALLILVRRWMFVGQPTAVQLGGGVPLYAMWSAETPLSLPTVEVEFREATVDDVDDIASAWPSDLAAIENNPYHLRRRLRKRFAKQTPCFVAVRSGRIVGAVWCIPWRFDAALPAAVQPCQAHEFSNGFVSPELRGRGLSGGLLSYAMQQMAQRGFRVAFSRIHSDNSASVRVKRKLGFERMGTFVSGLSLGRRYYFLKEGQMPGCAKRGARSLFAAKVESRDVPSCVILDGAVGATLQVMRSLGPRGVRTHFLGKSNHLRVIEASLYCASAFPIELSNRSLIDRAEQHFDELMQWVRRQAFRRKPLLIPSSDEACLLVAKYREEIQEWFVVCMARSELISVLSQSGCVHTPRLRRPEDAAVPPTAGHDGFRADDRLAGTRFHNQRLS